VSSDYTFDVLDSHADTSAGEGSSGATRGDFLRRLVTGGGALMAGGAVLAEFAPMARAASASTDVTILNAALILENLGVAFYGEALKYGHLTGETHYFARIVHAHEVAHARFVKSALGADAKPVPAFDFGSRTHSQALVQTTAYDIEGTCTAALVGVAPLLTRATLAKAGPLLPVEAQHVSWISNILGRNPAPAPFNVKDTIPGVEKIIAPLIKK
jgi:hypothetical protein